MSVTSAPHIVDLARQLQERVTVHNTAETARSSAVSIFKSIAFQKDDAESARDDAAAAHQAALGRFELSMASKKDVTTAKATYDAAEKSLSDLVVRHSAVAAQVTILETAAERAKADRLTSKRALAAALESEAKARVVDAWERFCDLSADFQRLHWLSGERPTPVVANLGAWERDRPGTLRNIAHRAGLNPDQHFVIAADHNTESEATLLARVDLG